MLHFAQVWPIHAAPVRSLLASGGEAPGEGRRVISVEGNATGQFASVLRGLGILEECRLMLRYDGMPFTGEEIARRVKP
jgi:2-oxoglutarate ferredoxin oxidoreductase subunit alpha